MKKEELIKIIKEEFKSHMMYDPESDKKTKAKSEEDHEEYAEKGYIHIDPEILRDILKDEGGASGMDPFLDSDDLDADEEEIEDALEVMPDVGKHEEGDWILADDEEIIVKIIEEELKIFLDEKRKKKKKKKKKKSKGKKDACYYKVKSRYSVWPSAYASGALVKCRKVGAKNWGKKSKKKK